MNADAITSLMYRSREAIQSLNGHWQAAMEASGLQPETDSPSYIEISNHRDATTLETGNSIANVLARFVYDHAGAYLSLLGPEVPVFAVATCVRSTMEPAAVLCWLLDPKIIATERARRIYLYRIACHHEQFDLASSQEEELNGEERVKRVVEKATNAGFSVEIRGTKQRKAELDGEAKPGPTAVIDQQLGMKEHYNVLSKIAHANYSAILDIGFNREFAGMSQSPITGQQMPQIEQALQPVVIVYCSKVMLLSLARVFWYQAKHLGWDLLQVEEQIEIAADMMNLPTQMRFWRS